MAESFEITKDGREGILEAKKVFPRLKARVNQGTKVVTVYDAKANEWVAVSKGDFIVSIADRFEVSDKEPEKAKPVEPVEIKLGQKKDEPKAETKPEAKEDKSEKDK